MAVKHSVVDLFCGIGGLTQGFRQEKFSVVAGFDIDKSCEYAYEANNNVKFHNEDLNLLPSEKIDELFIKNTTKVLVGCAPCQAFSTYSQKYKDNDKWKMLYTFGRIINEISPDIVSMENVPNLKNYRKGAVLKDFIEILKNNGYFISWNIINSSDYGVPQNRKRLILFASKFGEIEIIKPTHHNKKVTVRDTIGHLPLIRDGESYKSDLIHRARKLSRLNKKRIKATPKNGSWKDWPPELLLECHKKDSGKSFGNVYGRMSWENVAPTMTTQCTGLGNGRFGHPDQDRAISLREAALLQTFPSNYKFYDSSKSILASKIEMHIGNAVPVLLGKVIAKSIRKHLKKYA